MLREQVRKLLSANPRGAATGDGRQIGWSERRSRARFATLAPPIGRSALRRRVAAIAWHHRSAGHSWQAGHAAIRQTLTGISREHHRPVRPATALISADVKRLIAVCSGDLAGLRDRALFLVGLAGAFQRSELVGIDVAHFRFEAIGVTERIPRSKTDQEEEGVDTVLPHELIKAVA